MQWSIRRACAPLVTAGLTFLLAFLAYQLLHYVQRWIFWISSKHLSLFVVWYFRMNTFERSAFLALPKSAGGPNVHTIARQIAARSPSMQIRFAASVQAHLPFLLCPLRQCTPSCALSVSFSARINQICRRTGAICSAGNSFACMCTINPILCERNINADILSRW